MKIRANFDINKSINPTNSNYISKTLDPYTAKIAKFVYNLGFSADLVTLINFLLGMSAIVTMLIMRSYLGLVIAAILITLRNIGDTIDGKISRGSGMKSTYGGFSDIIADWLFFHAAFFVAIGFLTGNAIIGFLCVTGYMSREFARRKFEQKYGVSVKETVESKSKKISLIKSIITKYDLGNVFWLSPFILLINQPVWIIYFVAVMEYLLLFAELAFDYYCFLKKEKRKKQSEEITKKIC